MLKRAANKCKAFGVKINLIEGDIFDCNMSDSKLIIANYTLQFIRPLQREKLIKKINDSLNEKGIFILNKKKKIEC